MYLENEAERQEYVLSDTGKLWMGSYRQPKGRRWMFGQFDDAVLPTTMYLLERSTVTHADRGSPVQIARAISAIVSLHFRCSKTIGFVLQPKTCKMCYKENTAYNDFSVLPL